MICYICNAKCDEISNRYSQPVCLSCEDMFNKHDSKIKVFKSKYKEEHKYCPKCGSNSYITTLTGYPFYSDNPEGYKDLNDCTCSACGDVHTRHDRISSNNP